MPDEIIIDRDPDRTQLGNEGRLTVNIAELVGYDSAEVERVKKEMLTRGHHLDYQTLIDQGLIEPMEPDCN